MQKSNTPPSVSDFSKKAIKSVVLKKGFSHWLTLYPPVFGILGGLVAWLFGFTLLFYMGAGVFFMGVLSLMINIFLRSGAIESKYIQMLNEQLKKHSELVLVSLEGDLEECASLKGAERFALQGKEQFKRIKQKYENVQDLLGRKLNTGELTYGRFSGAAEQAYLSTLDNLKRVVAILKSAGTIDQEYIEKRLKELRSVGNPDEEEQQEIEALERRLSLRKDQFKKVSRLLMSNEKAMTQMEETTAKIAEMETDGKLAVTDFETAIEELQEVAKNASIYNR